MDTSRETVFVCGLGMVGIAIIEKLLALDEGKGRYRIVTCGEEPHFAYNRVGLTEYFAHRNIEQLFVNHWYAEHKPEAFEFHLGEQVVDIDRAAKRVHTDKGNSFSYDRLILATGSGAGFPPYVTAERAAACDGVFVYRGVADLERILNYGERPEITRAVVVGGGLLGLEAAKAVYDMPGVPDVSIINRQAYPLSRQLDADAGEMVLRKIESLGVDVITSVNVRDMLAKPHPDDPSREVFTGFVYDDGRTLEADLVIFAVGITPRDELARKVGLDVHRRGGIVVNDYLQTSDPSVYAVGECASWRGNTYGLIAPGIEMADILAFNLTQTDTTLGAFQPRKMNDPDLSTKLKLMGVDVASFGDYFADSRMTDALKTHEVKRRQASRARKGIAEPDIEEEIVPAPTIIQTAAHEAEEATAPVKSRKPGQRDPRTEPIRCLTYRDPFDSVYKKYIFTADGSYLLGGMMIGDVGDFVKLVSIVKKRKKLEVPPSQFIIGASKSGDDGADLDDDAQVCSCHNVTKQGVAACVRNGAMDMAAVKKATKAGTGCGGCLPLITSIMSAELKKAGKTLSNDLCPHFKMSRPDLFNVIKVKKLQTFRETLEAVGTSGDSLGCEICKPAVGSILASLNNRHVMAPDMHALQDTNDRFLGNIQRNGTFSVVPRVAAGEILPEHLIVIGQIAKDYGLYTKITGGQRLDLFGAQRADLPAIWKRLNDAGMESGHAYGKSLRTVKSCVGSTWCRYGIGDSVGLAVQLENRYKGLRSPHKFKGGVSGCVRECAEAQSKDFGLIATDKGWNIYVGGNGGATPRHAEILASDVPPSHVVRILDRFLAFYIMSADRLARTARWIESFDGGIAKLRDIILNDSLGICADLERYMDAYVGSYFDEWAEALKDPVKVAKFKQFANTDETSYNAEKIQERGQTRPADWPKDFPGVVLKETDIATPKSTWQWRKMCSMAALTPNAAGPTSVAVKWGDTQLAIFSVPKRGLYATQQMCPHKRAFVLDHGVVGEDKNGNPYVSCPLHKRNYDLQSGACSNDDSFGIISFEAKEEDGFVYLLLPEKDDLDAVLSTDKWMIRQATSEALGRGSAGQVEIVGPDGSHGPQGKVACASACGGQLSW